MDMRQRDKQETLRSLFARINLLEDLLQESSSEHIDNCGYWDAKAAEDCNCDSQVNGGDLTDNVSDALSLLRRRAEQLIEEG